tara:strand:- start:5188 stop:6900 length:1713 start_codon:yes stop_codon:yes gene_type:complete
MSIWNIKSPDQQTVQRLQKEFNAPEIIAKVMANRGINSLTDSKPFFDPSLDDLHDPFGMLNMNTAAENVAYHMENRKPIMIFGDYDVDGITGSSMLALTLKTLGADVSVYIPNRENEGYGLSKTGIDHAAERGAALIITCDCGINAVDEVDYAKGHNIEVIITDHHTPDPRLPDAFAILNPRQHDCEYPFKGLCGGGVAFKLASAVAEVLDEDPFVAYQHLDLITLGTAADIVPLTDENRIITYHGLKQLKETDNPGLKALLETSNLIDKELTVGRLLFWVAPRINAAGRMGDANRAVRLLITEDFFEATQLARALDNENRSRQAVQQTIVDEAILMVNNEVDLENDKAIVLWKEGWHSGIIGIVASRIKEEFCRPTVIISVDGDEGKGSARSIRGFDLYQNLARCARHLIGFGGHPMAAGLTISAANLEPFREEFRKIADSTLSYDDLVNRLDIDGEMSLNVIDKRFMDFIRKLSPYGPGNMRPAFVSTEVKVSGTPKLVGKGNHLKFTARQNGISYDAIGFNLAEHYQHLITGNPVDLVYVVEENEWQGRKTIQLNVRDIKPTGVNQS